MQEWIKRYPMMPQKLEAKLRRKGSKSMLFMPICVTSKAKRHIVITLSVCLFVCQSAVCYALLLLVPHAFCGTLAYK